MSAVSDAIAEKLYVLYGEFKPFPGTWQEELFVLEAYDLCQMRDSVGSYFTKIGHKKQRLTAILDDAEAKDYSERLSYLRAKYTRGVAHEKTLKLLENLETQDQPQRVVTAAKALLEQNYKMMEPMAPDDVRSFDRDPKKIIALHSVITAEEKARATNE